MLRLHNGASSHSRKNAEAEVVPFRSPQPRAAVTQAASAAAQAAQTCPQTSPRLQSSNICLPTNTLPEREKRPVYARLAMLSTCKVRTITSLSASGNTWSSCMCIMCDTTTTAFNCALLHLLTQAQSAASDCETMSHDGRCRADPDYTCTDALQVVLHNKNQQAEGLLQHRRAHSISRRTPAVPAPWAGCARRSRAPDYSQYPKP
jgi:hypothetical protein